MITGLNQAEQRAGGQYYDADKMKGPNKKITDKIKDKFHETTGYFSLLNENLTGDWLTLLIQPQPARHEIMYLRSGHAMCYDDM